MAVDYQIYQSRGSIFRQLYNTSCLYMSFNESSYIIEIHLAFVKKPPAFKNEKLKELVKQNFFIMASLANLNDWQNFIQIWVLTLARTCLAYRSIILCSAVYYLYCSSLMLDDICEWRLCMLACMNKT